MAPSLRKLLVINLKRVYKKMEKNLKISISDRFGLQNLIHVRLITSNIPLMVHYQSFVLHKLLISSGTDPGVVRCCSCTIKILLYIPLNITHQSKVNISKVTHRILKIWSFPKSKVKFKIKASRVGQKYPNRKILT